jgi:hypothetical protein
MTRIRSMALLLAAAAVATGVQAQSSQSGAKSAKAQKQQGIDIKRDAKEAWSDMQRVPSEVSKGVSAAGRDAAKTFREAGGKVRDGFTGKAPPTIPDPPK